MIIILLILLILPSCTSLSNLEYVQEHAVYRGTRRMVVFVQRWPCYLEKTQQTDLGSDFITKKTVFYGPWKPAGRMNPRAVDIADIDDQMMGEILTQVLEKKGYQVFISDITPTTGGTEKTVAGLMAMYQALDSRVDAFLFCYYSPTLYFAEARSTPPEHNKRSYSLGEVVNILEPLNGRVTWSGPRAALAPKHSISHTFVHLSISCIGALNWKPFWEVADSQAGGGLRPWLIECLPGTTDANYYADAAMIQRLMCDNLTCRLKHMIPYSF